MSVNLLKRAPRGIVLRQVTYEGLEWDAAPAGPGFDEVSIAVALAFAGSPTYTLQWQVWKEYERLTTCEGMGRVASPHIRIVDASQRWNHLLGARVAGQRVAMQDTMWGPQPWSTRLDFDTGDSLVVCLGELTAAGAPTYLPDSLLVTGSQPHATAYRPCAAHASAWTDG
jgi:hypothetical protein